MANTLTSNIYPPTLPTYAETFRASSGSCNIFFAFPKYNSIEEINSLAQVVIYKQNTNISVLKKSLAPCEIICKEWQEASEAEIKKYNLTDRRYKITLSAEDLEPELDDIDEDTGLQKESGSFKINTYYRVQIRFMAKNLEVPSVIKSDWLGQHMNSFSEWSTVCLIRGISDIKLSIRGFGDENNISGEIDWPSGEVDIIGKIEFTNKEEKDYLKSYYIHFYDEEESLIWDSGEIYSLANESVGVNELNCTIGRIFKDGEKYILKIGYCTKTMYFEEKTYAIRILDQGMEKLKVYFSSVEDVDNGRIILNIRNSTTDVFSGNFIIRRSCSDSDFTIWEDVSIASVEGSALNYTFYDYTIESGKWYRYGIQTRNTSGQRGLLTIYNKDLIVDFEDIFLNADGKQLCIKYNPQISSFQRTISENKVETIGGKYPYIKRNGDMEYKQFPISGLITYFMDRHDIESTFVRDSINSGHTFKEENSHNPNDDDALLINREELYGEEIASFYDSRNDWINIEDHQYMEPWQDINNTIYEKDFREAVMDFLYKNNVKLFKSPTEGNILVKLMNITFTPNQTLGRKIWTFNATAYEIDEFSIINCDAYGIQKIGSAIPYFEYVNNYLGQINIKATANSNIIDDYLSEIYNADVYHKEKYETKINYLNHLKIEFLGKPYLINIRDGEPSVWESDPTDPNLEQKIKDAIRGYLVYINSKPIIVRNSNIYELKGANIQIKNISFPIETEIFLDYELSLSQTPKPQQIITSMYYINKIGQVKYLFQPNINLINYIRSRFNFESKDMGGSFYQALSSINGIRIEASEGTIAWVRESGEDVMHKHLIGPTGSLDFWDPETSIQEIYFQGIRMTEAPDYELKRDTVIENKYINTREEYESEDEVINPIKNGLYMINNKPEIWYHGFWYQATKIVEEEDSSIYSYEIECPVDAMVDYYCEIVKGYYLAD